MAKPFCSLAGGIILKASSSKYLVVGGSSGGLHLFLRSHETGKVSHLKDGELGRLPVLRFNSKNFFVNSCDQGDSLLVFDDAVFTQISKTASDGVDQLLSHQWTADLSSIVEYVEDVWHKGQKGFLSFYFSFLLGNFQKKKMGRKREMRELDLFKKGFQIFLL